MTWRVTTALLAGVALAMSVPAVRHWREAPPPPPPPIIATLAPPADADFGSGNDQVLDAALSPSGRALVFTASRRGEAQLWTRALDSDRAEPVPATNGAAMPAFSADGTAVWYFAEGKLRTSDLQGGGRRDLADARSPAGVSVRGDGTVLFVPGPGPVKRLAGGAIVDATTLRDGERTHAFPSWTGSGDAFVYLATRDDGRRQLRLHDGEDDVELTRSDSHGVMVADHLVYVRDGTLRAERFDPDKRRLDTRARTLATTVGVTQAGQGAFAITDRLLVSAPIARRAVVPRWLTPDGEALAPVAEPGEYWQVRLSPDERTVAMTVRDPLLKTLDIFTLPAQGGTLTRVTHALAADSDPVWAPDGTRIVFRSWQSGRPDLFTRALVGRGATNTMDDLFFAGPSEEFPTDWLGSDVIFHARSAEKGFDIFRTRRGAEPEALARSTFNEIDGRVSPDGRWLAYTSDESGQYDVYVVSLDGRRPRTRVSTAGGTRPQWTSGGRALVFLRGNDVLAVQTSVTGNAIETTVPVRLLSIPGVRDVVISRDGQRVLAIVPDLPAPAPPVRLVVGWNQAGNPGSPNSRQPQP